MSHMLRRWECLRTAGSNRFEQIENIECAVTSGLSGVGANIGDIDVTLDTTPVTDKLDLVIATLLAMPQAEGLQPIKVCYDDGTSGYLALWIPDESDTSNLVKIYFDDQHNVIGAKTIIDCPKIDFLITDDCN